MNTYNTHTRTHNKCYGTNCTARKYEKKKESKKFSKTGGWRGMGEEGVRYINTYIVDKKKFEKEKEFEKG